MNRRTSTVVAFAALSIIAAACTADGVSECGFFVLSSLILGGEALKRAPAEH